MLGEGVGVGGGIATDWAIFSTFRWLNPSKPQKVT